jgi:hypothetical protein
VSEDDLDTAALRRVIRLQPDDLHPLDIWLMALLSPLPAMVTLFGHEQAIAMFDVVIDIASEAAQARVAGQSVSINDMVDRWTKHFPDRGFHGHACASILTMLAQGYLAHCSDREKVAPALRARVRESAEAIEAWQR